MNSKFLLNRATGSEKTLIRESLMEDLKNKLLSICPNEEELCNIVVDICYKKSNNSKHFAWQCVEIKSLRTC